MATFDRRSDGVVFLVRLTPKGGREAVEGWASAADGKSHLKARVRTAPEGGKANAALIALLAKELGVPKSALAITGGEKARLKTVAATGDTSALAARLEMFGEA
jgi:uncharacterized protein YggU (UPF0235/DUF167 family)